ncbi:MBL fold metallo-hydrolase [Halostella sp. PRR32]|uniref:MBL fold metallo-hydrolase n=1 Tax=Halostella sp. PRR32 TaxID=3098147 RepID=UPI002B1D2618|nr:MBL fold metallo-hydrolase [Halostella sp. PRR32]
MVSIEVLGIAQDAGVPHIGCQCPNCETAREDPERVRYSSAIRLEDDGHYLFDATPDIRFQLSETPDSVFLTHAHLGHLPGLLFLGRESANADEIPVYCTEGLADVIRENVPLRLLVDEGNIDLRLIDDGSGVSLGEASVTAVPVEHRETVPTGTLAYRIDGPDRSLLYMSDIDKLTTDALDLIRNVDIALVDGTFWSRDELDRVETVPHPTVKSSLDVLAAVDTEILFTHLNHTNPLLDPESDARKHLEEAGFSVAKEGKTFDL